jgi:hypothetical protein
MLTNIMIFKKFIINNKQVIGIDELSQSIIPSLQELA